ncbi:four helix bundle protein [Candidatus Saccharibacteria bacterium CG10_big_fil_rev_8_21_14_0_10_47_8]|nr:MAG: four helix bundle protein [Candidatus Saccharibacteria bacterium CG10_big_fil_rev_8_21_14_0_10_47_8]
MKNQTAVKPSITFENLEVWQKSRKLAVYIYKLTKKFPVEERYGLVPQMRRAAISISSNIAEGFARYKTKDKEHFYVMASASLSELLNQLILSSDFDYISATELDHSKLLLTDTRRSLLALLRAHRS